MSFDFFFGVGLLKTSVPKCLNLYIIIHGNCFTRALLFAMYEYCTFQVFNIRYPEMQVNGAKCAIKNLSVWLVSVYGR